jgi:hypothetical protein
MQQWLVESFENNSLLEITTWKDGFFTSRVGSVTKIDPLNKKVHIQDEWDSLITIGFFHITNVVTK